MCTYRKMPVLLLSLSCFVIVANLQYVNTQERLCPVPCNIEINCDPYYSGPPVWVIMDDDTCKLFKTDCLFAVESCKRQTECKPRVFTTVKNICQTKCKDGCENLPTQPVCGGFPYLTVNGGRENQIITFRNQCELDKFSCWNSIAYTYVREGPCFKSY